MVQTCAGTKPFLLRKGRVGILKIYYQNSCWCRCAQTPNNGQRSGLVRTPTMDQKEEVNETVTNCNGLKMIALDGKMRMTDVANTEQLFRLIQSDAIKH